MRHIRQLYILGDVHGNFKALNWFINQEIRRNPAVRSMAEYCQAAGADFQALIVQSATEVGGLKKSQHNVCLRFLTSFSDNDTIY